jgi:hypothetical protein
MQKLLHHRLQMDEIINDIHRGINSHDEFTALHFTAAGVHSNFAGESADNVWNEGK